MKHFTRAVENDKMFEITCDCGWTKSCRKRGKPYGVWHYGRVIHVPGAPLLQGKATP